ncbi:MAG: mycoredoxin [Chloroflexaceae bacterium]|nr:mycoredoxin [Chloroflexaceae bacterium]NJL34344.1 mycoredoxin [Chloroflexaceae bacterium]NJO05746.1 mycoredoxin [Chloroflexaceae bacterium]
MEDQKTIVYATTWCPHCKRAARFLDENDIEYDYVNIEEDEHAADFVMSVNKGNRTVPTVVFPDGSVMTNPSNLILRQKLIVEVS